VVPRGRNLYSRLAILLLAILAATSILAAQEVLTNAAIVEMVKARLSDEVIIAQIQKSGGNYSLGYKDLLTLKSQGVSDKVLAAMQVKVNGSDAGAQAQSGKVGASAGSQTARVKPQPIRADGAPREWQVNDATDVMSDKKHFEAVRALPLPDRSGDMSIVATCDAVSILMDFTYIPKDKQTGFKQNWNGNTVTQGGLLWALAAASRHAKAWADMRVRIDNDPPVTVSSEKDFPNQASLMFFADPMKASTGQALSKSDPTGGTLVGMLLATKGAGSRDEAAKAQSILVEFTLANGQQEIIQIDPGQPGFQKFISRCDDEFWTGPARRKAEEEARKNAEEEARIRPILEAKNNAVLGIQQAHGPAEDGFKFLYSLSWSDRQYTGTVEGFATRFPEFFKRAVLTSGIDVRNVDEKIAYVMDAVRTCGQITPEMEMAKHAFQPNGQRAFGGGPGGTEDLGPLGQQYEICNKKGRSIPLPGTEVSVPGKRGINLSIYPINRSGTNVAARWMDGNGFRVAVTFTGLDHDGDDLRGRLQPGADYTIISAIIHSH
jgi:hypothetical protein